MNSKRRESILNILEQLYKVRQNNMFQFIILFFTIFDYSNNFLITYHENPKNLLKAINLSNLIEY